MQHANGLPFFCNAFFLLLPPYLDLYTKYFADSFCLSVFIGLCIRVSLNLPLCLLWSIRFVASSGNDVMSLLAKEYENNYSWNCALIFFKKNNEASSFSHKAKFSMFCSGLTILLCLDQPK